MRPDEPHDPRLDAELLERGAAGDDGATHALVRRHIRGATLLAAQLLGDRDDAEDVVQDAFIIVLRRAGDFRPESPFAPWLFGIVRRLARKTKARALRRWHLLEKWRGGQGAAAVLPNAHASLEADEARAIIARMPPMQRACCELAFLHDLTIEEIAEMHGMAASTVRQHIFRGRRLLRLSLSADLPEEMDR
jgi:RNA polymerase sigma-70 factor (ECF subfamily)